MARAGKGALIGLAVDALLAALLLSALSDLDFGDCWGGEGGNC
jgi:hypothetical protein